MQAVQTGARARVRARDPPARAARLPDPPARPSIRLDAQLPFWRAVRDRYVTGLVDVVGWLR